MNRILLVIFLSVMVLTLILLYLLFKSTSDDYLPGLVSSDTQQLTGTQPTPSSPETAQNNIIKIEITDEGFNPKEINVKANQKIFLRIENRSESDVDWLLLGTDYFAELIPPLGAETLEFRIAKGEYSFNTSSEEFEPGVLVVE